MKKTILALVFGIVGFAYIFFALLGLLIVMGAIFTSLLIAGWAVTAFFLAIFLQAFIALGCGIIALILSFKALPGSKMRIISRVFGIVTIVLSLFGIIATFLVMFC